MTKTVEIKEFAERVERLCDFLLDKVERNGSEDLRIIEDLKNDAADLQTVAIIPTTFDGLSNYMRGIPQVPEKE